jgi:glutathione synthase/RimK-type ligase-like ATP-grasp enzyme
MNYLIATQPDDTHAMITKLALESLGHDVRLFFTADLPTRQTNSVYLDQNQYEWESSGEEGVSSQKDYDVVWWRRVRKPYLPKSLTHPDDYTFIARENVLFQEGIAYNLAPSAWWVNPKDAALRASSKLLQLKVASAVGMKIPVSLFSNDPLQVRAFLQKTAKQGAIYKPLCSQFWFEAKYIRIAYTAKINLLDLPGDEVLRLTPGIYQEEIKKQYEVRVTCFGDYLIAAKLDSQAHEEGVIDWRAITPGKMKVTPYQLPTLLEDQIRRFMRKMGLVTGSIDLIKTMDGNYIFLEVNEQGQFLWIEEYCQDISVLNPFIEFLTHKKVTRDSHYHAEHTIEKYRSDINPLVQMYLKHHIDLNSCKNFMN